jgi:hypothetical protein
LRIQSELGMPQLTTILTSFTSSPMEAQLEATSTLDLSHGELITLEKQDY